MSLDPSFRLAISRTKRRIFRHYSLVQKLIVTVGLVALLVLAIVFVFPAAKLAKEFLFGPVNIFSMMLGNSMELKNDNGRTNILLLGIGGAGHEGPNLTDAIIVLSVKTKLTSEEKKSLPPVVLISIPRDIYLESLTDKINSAYQTGLDKGVGTRLVKGVITSVSGIPIHYVVIVDFSAFDDIIDILGGVDVNVEHTLDDFGYPIDGKEKDTCGFPLEEVATRSAAISLSPFSEVDAFPCRYEHIHFDTGPIHMNGTSTLKFVRSRHALGDEGTDFARSRRQQLVLSAIKEKALSTQTILNPQKIWDLYDQLKTHISSDLDQKEVNILVNLGLKYRSAQIKMTAIDQNLLENPPVDARGWILLPKGGNWDQVHEFVKKQLESQ